MCRADWRLLLQLELQAEMAQLMPHSSLCVIDSPHGHDAFLSVLCDALLCCMITTPSCTDLYVLRNAVEITHLNAVVAKWLNTGITVAETIHKSASPRL